MAHPWRDRFLSKSHCLAATAVASIGLALGLLFGGAAWGQSATPTPHGPPATHGSQKDKQEKGTAEIPTPLPRGKKLVLKDGTFQLVRSYERKGDRVRYYSVERSAWEEIPADLVDWDATAKAEAEDAKKRQELAEKAKQREAAELAEEIDVGSSIEITPGVFLPEGEGVYAIQDKLVLPMVQTMSQVKLNKGSVMKQILVPVPVIPTKHRVEVAGKRAVLRLTTPQPEFYFRTADAREPEMELIRAQVKGETRQVAVISTDIVGDQDEKRDYIPMQKWKVAKGVYRFTISQSLQPGEYALGEILAEGINMYVWDFGIDPPGTPPVPDPKAAPKSKQPAPPKRQE